MVGETEEEVSRTILHGDALPAEEVQGGSGGRRRAGRRPAAGGDAMRLNQVVQSVPPSGIRRFFDLVSQMEDVISLGVGEPDFVTPWRIREAAIYSIEKGFTTYTSNWGLLELRQAVALYLDRRYGVEYNPQNEILITVGVSEGL